MLLSRFPLMMLQVETAPSVEDTPSVSAVASAEVEVAGEVTMREEPVALSSPGQASSADKKRFSATNPFNLFEDDEGEDQLFAVCVWPHCHRSSPAAGIQEDGGCTSKGHRKVGFV
jgi:hypothetical protein